MTLTLTPELEAIVKERLARGPFGSAEEVIAAGLRMLSESAQKESELLALLAEAEEDVRAGRVAPFDPVATAARVKARREGRS